MSDTIRIRDEILEVLYWLRGEGIHEEVRPDDLRPFVGLEPETARRHLEALAPLLGQGHGTACAPGCECQDPAHPDQDCPTHGLRAHAHPS
jgi:hypothetical protein